MTQWSPAESGRFRFKEWLDDDTIVYDIIGGNTHLVQPLAMELLQLIREKAPRSADELTAEIWPLFPCEPVSEIVASIDAALAQLCSLGLVVGRSA